MILGFQSAAECNLKSIRPRFKKYKDSRYAVVDIPASMVREGIGATPTLGSLQLFKRQIRKRTSVDPIFLLQRQRQFYKDMPEELKRFDSVLNRQVGQIRGLNCLEAILLDTQLKFFKPNTEFEAYIFNRVGGKKLRILFQTQGQVSVVRYSIILNQIRNLVSQGWNLKIHLHNHPFSFENPYGDISGTILPSSADLLSYQGLKNQFGLKLGIVINGFNALVLTPKEFGL